MTALGTVLDREAFIEAPLDGACVSQPMQVDIAPVWDDEDGAFPLPRQTEAILGTGQDFAAARASLELAIAEGRSRKVVFGRFERLQQVAAARALAAGVGVEDLHLIWERTRPIQRAIVTCLMEHADA